MTTKPLLSRLAEADRAWRRTEGSEVFLRSLKYGICLIAVLVAVDLVFQLGSWTRLVLGALAGVALLVFGGILVVRTFVKRSSLLKTARMLESRDPALGSKVINAIQLEEQASDESLPDLTRKLARLAVTEAERDLAPHPFVPLTRSPTMGRSLGRACAVLAGALVPVVIFAPIAGREFLRFVDPFGDHPAFSFTTLEIVTPGSDGTSVVFHRSANVEVEYTGHRPGELFLTVEHADGSGGTVTIPMFPQGESGFVQQIEKVESDLLIRAHTKTHRSVSASRKIGVVLTPQLEAASVAVESPAYTQLRPRETKLGMEKGTPPTVTALRGSRVEFALTSNRPLSAGSAGLQSTSPELLEIPLLPGEGETANIARAGLVAEESGRLQFDLRDVTGLSSDREIAVNLVVTHDLPPAIEIVEPATDGFIVDTFSTKVAFRCNDDYGLKWMRFHTGVNDTFGEPREVAGSSEPLQLEALETVEIAPSKMGAVPGDVISVFGEAGDIRPDPQMSRSRTLKLEVISEDQYNEYLRLRTEIRDLEKKYSNLHDELRELAEAQRALAEKAESARQSANDSERDELAAAQSELNAKLEKLAGRMETATRENPLYDVEHEFQKVLNEEAAKVRDSVAANRKALEDFLKTPPSEDSLAQFSEEGEAQADRLDPAREMAEQKIAEAMKDADQIQQLLKAVGAYQRLYAVQADLASQTAAFRSRTELSHEDKLSLQQMAGTERLVGEGLSQIIRDLREGAERAVEAYPKAAEDARNIADAIEGANLPNLADRSSQVMLAGRAGPSHDQAEHLRAEMEKLMGECSQCQGGMGGEFETRLSLMRGMRPGNTFAQMSQCRNFGLNLGQGQGMGGGGMGFAGMMGRGGPQMGPGMSLLGGESVLGQDARESANASSGKAQADPAEGIDLSEGAGNSPGPRQLDRPSDAITGDAVIGEYSDLVDAYFRKLTSSKPAQP